ncbi:MAG: hypothetical protein RJB10_1444, partial [Pseudomonadota bacterium]
LVLSAKEGVTPLQDLILQYKREVVNFRDKQCDDVWLFARFNAS